ncbi:MAG: hypothetical protein LBN11_00540 [Tannerella sp.]|jgi:hypothetical protein|nr:hypothetical protein [Tannerella sp.]
MKKIITSVFILITPIFYAQTPDEMMSWLPEISGWQKPMAKEVFDSDHLFDRINGAAPLFIENGFQEMTTADYKQGDDYITFQIYRHDTPENAFGMYSSERSPELTFYPIGGEAHGDNESFFFFNGSLYVKIRSNKSSDGVGEALKKIAEAFVANSGVKASLPKIFEYFPQKNKIPNEETYITSNFIGHEFLNKVYVCKYKAETDIPYQLFVIKAESPKSAKGILNSYFGYTKQSLNFKEGFLTVKDKYNGDIPCVWKGNYIIGIYNENGDNVPKAKEIIESVKLPQ